MADPLPLFAFFPHNFRIEVAFYRKAANLNQLDYHRQAWNRTLILDIGEIPSNYWLGVNAGFAVMFILIILLVVLGIWSRMTNNAIMGFVVDNFDLSMAIGFVSTIVIFALSYILSVGLFKRKYC